MPPSIPISIPTSAPTLTAAIEQTHVLFKLTPNSDSTLAFELLVPKPWAYSSEFGPVISTLLHPQGLGFFVESLAPGAPVIAVTVTRCPFEIPIDVWARLSFEHEGWTILASQWYPGPNGVFFDLSASRHEDDIELIRRSSIRVDQGRIFSVNCICAKSHWDANKETFWLAHASFALQQGSGNATLENHARASAEQPAFHFGYPVSWTPERAVPHSDAVSGVHLRLIDRERQVLLAYLIVQARHKPTSARSSLAPLVSEATTMLEKATVEFKSAAHLLSDDADPRGEAVPGWLGDFSTSGRLAGSDIQVRMSFIDRANTVFSLALLSPLLEDDRLVSLRAQRVLEIVRSTLRVG
jgi:hypothetical protein